MVKIVRLAAALVLIVDRCLAVIYSLNESQYNLMPPLYALDDYSRCLLAPAGTYCVLDLDLRGDNDLMRMIRGYSEHRIKHFNHTQIHRGVCVTSTCKAYIQNRSIEREKDLEYVLEECLNRTLWEEYGLNGKVAEIRYCKKTHEHLDIDNADLIVAVVYLVIILLNVVGSSYDILFCKNKEKSGNPYLLAFSVPRNWKKMVAPSGGPDPRLDRLKLFHGLRTMTMICVFFSHTTLITAYSYVQNPLYIEKAYDDVLKQILFNGSLVTHTFFVMSAFLLAYNFQLQAERRPVTWTLLPKGVLLRWLRLTPTYALVLATICTWMRHLGSGPLWELVVTSEAVACRRFWWAHVFYFNNYVYEDAFCAGQTWYLAADTQLFCLGLVVCVAARSPRARAAALALLFAASILIPALHTYLQDLDAVVIQSPEAYRNLYATDNTFRLLYTRGHTNISTYTLGLVGGFLAHHWQSTGKDLSRYKGYRWLFWLTFPAGVGVLLSGALFYEDGAPAGDLLRVAYAAAYRPVFQALIVVFILGTVFKFESVYRGIVEWRGFTWPGRVSYSAFLLHTLFQRALVGGARAPVYMADYSIFIILTATIFLSYSCGALLWMAVEAPANNVTKALLGSGGGGGATPKTADNSSKV